MLRHRHVPPRRVAPVLIALALAGVAAGAPPGGAAPVPTPSAAGVAPALCRLQGQLPAPLWNRLARLLRIRCEPQATTTTITTTITSSSSSSSSSTRTTGTRTTTTLYVPADNWGLEGYRYVVTCPGTREAPGLCSEPVATPGRVRVGNREVQTDARGWWRALGLFGPVELEGIVEPPPNRVSVCPVVMGDPSDGGPYNNRADVTCYVYFV